MCGIAGYLGARELDPLSIERGFASLHHRGPDGRGLYHERTPDGRTICLLHTRLRILDLDDRAAQPMRHGRHVLTYNGELFNYRECAAEAAWGDLRTSSDTEVFLRMLAADGPAALDRAEGMWAYAHYDEACGELTLGRDRFGEKPLYWLEADDGIYFASEIKAIAALRGAPLEIDEQQVLRYLVHGYRAIAKDPMRPSFYRSVRAVPPATTMRVTADGIEAPVPYWRPSLVRDSSMTFGDAVDAVRSALRRAVEVRLRADVPIAFLMSGGVDSNALIALAQREFGHDVHGFTIINRDERYAEQHLVDAAVQELGVRHHTIELDPTGFLDRLDAQVAQHDGPVCTISFVVHQRLVEAVAEHGYRVVIAGTGADEILTGYYQHHNAYLHAVADDPAQYAAARAAWERHLAPIVRNPFLRQPDLFLNDPGCRDYIYFDADAFRTMLVNDWSEPFAEQTYDTSLMRSRMLNELQYETVPPMLREEDLNAMSVSIENRTPFLDRGLNDACARIPDHLMIRDGYAKAILRDAMRGIVPDAVLDERRKVGFNAPVHELLHPSDPAVRDRVLADGPIYDLVRREAVERLLDQETLANSRSKFLFSILNAQAFLAQHAAAAAGVAR